MKLKNTILALILITVCISASKAQDIHFSKFFDAPTVLNPANTGNYIGNWRVLLNYRDQGLNTLDPYKTSSAAFDIPIYIKNERASIGINWLNDKSSDNTLIVNKIFLTTGYFRRITERSYLHLGLGAGFVNKSYSLAGLSFPDQFDMSSGYFNSDMGTQENMENSRLWYIDLNWGLIWSYKAPKFTSEIGFAMFHYNKPEETFFDSGNRLDPKYSTHAFIEKVIFSNVYVKPKLLYVYQNKASELVTGSDIGILFPESKSVKNIYTGAYFRGGFLRNADAFIVKMGFNLKNYDISIAYDFEIPGADQFSYPKNSLEISVAFIRPDTNLKNKTIPCTIF